ncbi:Family with sequence similarity 174 member A [Podarcis lilfordi]|uniref:Transmembrane protein 157 n=1 Tax=Podarcis lilfordi TaxID=74358 RepID=A0AA35KZN7_9SAUR|nr:Family with sequence similarity 174 member A [Podarcis lilfordi]
MRRLWPGLLLLLLLAGLWGGEALPAQGVLRPPPPSPPPAAPSSSSASAAPGGHDAAPALGSSSGSPAGEAARSSNASGVGSVAAAVPAPPERNQLMTQRALSVLVLASAALIVYFVIRTVRLRRRNRKTRRYGVLDTNIENTELTPLEQDDDDDDTTLFDANHPRR